MNSYNLSGFAEKRAKSVSLIFMVFQRDHPTHSTQQALATRQLGARRSFEERRLAEGANAFAAIDHGSTSDTKIILRP
jgi:hypothetical protein